MSKITLDNYEIENSIAITKYQQKQSAILNEYFYIQEPHIIQQLLADIQIVDRGNTEDAQFLSAFFWNQKQSEYTIAENIGKFFLRLSGFKDENTLIEVKDLSLEEKFNFLHNINIITSQNSYLNNLFGLDNKKFSQFAIEMAENKDIISKIKVLYCNEWIEEQDMLNVLKSEISFIKKLNLNIKLQNNLPQRKSMKKIKI